MQNSIRFFCFYVLRELRLKGTISIAWVKGSTLLGTKRRCSHRVRIGTLEKEKMRERNVGHRRFVRISSCEGTRLVCLEQHLGVARTRPATPEIVESEREERNKRRIRELVRASSCIAGFVPWMERHPIHFEAKQARSQHATR